MIKDMYQLRFYFSCIKNCTKHKRPETESINHQSILHQVLVNDEEKLKSAWGARQSVIVNVVLIIKGSLLLKKKGAVVEEKTTSTTPRKLNRVDMKGTF
jgi:hypothetical protein